MKKEILAIIPARGGSKAIPRKNIVPLCGKPLIQYTIEAAQAAPAVSRLILSSDDETIMAFCRERGVEVPFQRPVDLAGDEAPMLDVVRHAVFFLKEKEGYQPEFVVLLQPTSPLRTSTDIEQALKLLRDSPADSVVSVVSVPHQFNPYSVMRLEGDCLVPFLPSDERKNLRQLKPAFYGRNGPAILAVRQRCLLAGHSLYGDKIIPYVMDKERSLDIDDASDLQMAEYILQARAHGHP